MSSDKLFGRARPPAKSARRTRAPETRMLLVEPLEERRLLASGDLLRTLTNRDFDGAVALDGDLAVLGLMLFGSASHDYCGAGVYSATSGDQISTMTAAGAPKDRYYPPTVAISNTTAVVGNPEGNNAITFDATSGAMIHGFGSGISNKFGYSVAISGNTLVVGAPDDNTGAWNAGSAYVFDAATGNLLWTLRNPAPNDYDRFGWSVAVSGTTVVVAGTNSRVYAFDVTSGAQLWGGQVLGQHVAASGSAGAVGNAGAGQVSILDIATGNLLHQIQNPSTGNDLFGYAVALSGTTLVVGAPPGYPAMDNGSAFAFDTSTGGLIATLDNPNPASAARWGESVAVSADRALVSPGYQYGDSAFLFDVSGPPLPPPNSVTFDGTSGDDTFAFSTDGTYHYVSVALAGQPTQDYTYPASAPVTITFNGNGGNDKITIDGGPQDETVVTHPNSVTFSGPTGTYQVIGSDIDDIRVTGGAGTGQTATMYDTPGANDTFTSQPAFADMTTTGYPYYCKVTGFGPVNAYASGDAGDTAKFYDSPGADTFTAQPGLASMSGPGYATNVAHGFKKQYGYASFVYGQSGQGDRANLYDSVGNDTWIGYGALNYSEITGPGGLYYVRAQGFDQQYGYETSDPFGGGAQNVARFYDTPGNDVFNAKGDYSYLSGVSSQAWWFATGFQRVYAQKTAGGFDQAFFSHTTGNYKMTYNVRSYQGYAADIQPNGSNTFYNIASDFNEYEGVASIPGNTDEAFFRTTGGGDTLTFGPVAGTNFAIADLLGTTPPPASKPVHLYAYGFHSNTLLRDTTDTAFNTATLTGTSGNDTFVGTPNDSTFTLSTGPIARLTYWPQPTPRGFDKITINAAGGNDTATLTGASTGTNTFWGHLADAVLSDGTLDLTTGDLTTPRSPFGYYFKLSGFDTLADHVTANGPATATNQRRVNPVDYALTFTGTWLDI